MMDQRRSIIANLIRQSQPAQLEQQMRGQIGAAQYPGYVPLGQPMQAPMQPPAAPMGGAGMQQVYVPTDDEFSRMRARAGSQGAFGAGFGIMNLFNMVNAAHNDGKKGEWASVPREKPRAYR